MGCCFNKEIYTEKTESFKNMKEGLNKSLKDINTTLDSINDWDTLLNPKDEFNEKINSDEKSIIDNNDKKENECLIGFFICGWLFCFFHFIYARDSNATTGLWRAQHGRILKKTVRGTVFRRGYPEGLALRQRNETPLAGVLFF